MKTHYVDTWIQIPRSCRIKWGAVAGTIEVIMRPTSTGFSTREAEMRYAPTKRKAKLAAIEAAKREGIWE